jgi:hypothetical protein
MVREYTHELHKEIRSISGGYTLEREETIAVKGKEVLYVVGDGFADSSCCGFWACRYAVVPGYVVEWKYKKDGRGNPVSMVEAIEDEGLKRELTSILETKEGVSQVQFW